MTIAIVVYKMIGKQIREIVIGGFMFLFGVTSIVIGIRSGRKITAKYTYVPVLFGLWQMKKLTERDVTHIDVPDIEAVRIGMGVVSTVIGLFIMV